MTIIRWSFLFFAFCLIVSCQKQDTVGPRYVPKLMEIPKGFPELVVPEDNEFSTVRWELGKKLFYDPILSVDSSLSCATCHKQELAFSDNLDFSPGVFDRAGTRNAPGLANVAYHPYFTREGGVPTLEMQILVPIQEHNEFDFNIVLLAERLGKDSSYISLAQEAYQRLPDPFVITRALACFERSLLSGYSPYDRHLQEEESETLSPAALRGMDLFFSTKTNCSQCHGGFNFTNYAFENNGLYETYPDEGRFRLTKEDADRGLFKVPSLRNIELTGPYMHDGSIHSLEEVIEHYQSGGSTHPNKSQLIQPLQLSAEDKRDLLQFLKSLTDKTFVDNPIFQP